MAFQKSGVIVTTERQHIGKADVSLANLTEAARILGISVPATETIKTIVAFREPAKDQPTGE